MEERLLEVKNLKVSFNVGKKKLTAVENVEFSLDKGKVIGSWENPDVERA